ncbi:HAMP domain-containing sensor histidine kinase [uncultured Granulicatella sp.]|uniref:sensor histidine kinase n=1 Tax=uncultured Granulicatella sp. TaxID=316089 RepID=UPI0028DB402C|nr:HAMP domain-containing sensor histidine kinase [uncultured Granulicatella sp.]
MFQQLQKSFVKNAMLSFSLVLVIVLVLLNGIYYQQTIEQIDRVATMLIDHNGTFPDAPSTNPPVNFLEELTTLGTEWKKDDQLSTRYAVITFSNQQIQSINRTNLVSVDEEVLKKQTQEIISGNVQSGWIQKLRFRLSKGNEESLLVFVDANKEIQQIKRLLIVSILVFLICLIGIYGLIRFSSKRAIQPFVDNVKKQQQFISNASHEIKTPLAVLSANNDLLAMMGTENRCIDSNRRQIKRLNALVEQMLLLARYDESQSSIVTEKIDLIQISKEIIDDVSPILQEKGLSVQFQGELSCVVNADKSSIQELIRILIDNAMKYTVIDKVITIKVSAGVFCIANQTESMKEEQVNQLFDRFYRVDTSRNRTTGGSGLGLSIAQKIAEINQLELSAELVEQNRIQFIIASKNR